jgi:hypothetical protein
MDDGAVLADEVLLGANDFAAATAGPQLAPQLTVAKDGELILGPRKQCSARRTTPLRTLTCA